MDPIDNAIITFHSIASIICWFCLLLMFCYGVVMEKFDYIKKSLVTFGALSIIMFFLSSSSFLMVYAKLIDVDLNYVRDTFTATTNQLGKIFSYLLFISRLRYSFKGTKYGSNKYIFIILYCTIKF